MAAGGRLTLAEMWAQRSWAAVSAYAPHAAATPEAKDDFHAELGALVTREGARRIVVIGDFNV